VRFLAELLDLCQRPVGIGETLGVEIETVGAEVHLHLVDTTRDGAGSLLDGFDVEIARAKGSDSRAVVHTELALIPRPQAVAAELVELGAVGVSTLDAKWNEVNQTHDKGDIGEVRKGSPVRFPRVARRGKQYRCRDKTGGDASKWACRDLDDLAAAEVFDLRRHDLDDTQ